MGFRQVKELTGTLSPGKPCQSAATDGHQGLGHLVAAALGIFPRVQPEEDAGPAVRRQHGQGADQHAKPSQRQNLLFGNPRQHIHAQHQRKDNRSGSHIRLEEDQCRKGKGEEKGLVGRISQQSDPLAALQPVSQKGGRHQDDRNLGQFRGLQRKTGNIDPAPGTVYHCPDAQRRRQKQYGDPDYHFIKPGAHHTFIIQMKRSDPEHHPAHSRINQIAETR